MKEYCQMKKFSTTNLTLAWNFNQKNEFTHCKDLLIVSLFHFECIPLWIVVRSTFLYNTLLAKMKQIWSVRHPTGNPLFASGNNSLTFRFSQLHAGHQTGHYSIFTLEMFLTVDFRGFYDFYLYLRLHKWAINFTIMDFILDFPVDFIRKLLLGLPRRRYKKQIYQQIYQFFKNFSSVTAE